MVSVARRLALLALALAAAPARAQGGITPQDIAKMRADLASRPSVGSLSPACLNPAGGTLAVQGLNFGASQGRRRLALVVSGRAVDLAVTAWSNGHIDARAPAIPGATEGEAASFEMLDDAGSPLPGAVRSTHFCHTHFEQNVSFDLGLCGFSGPYLEFDTYPNRGATSVSERALADRPGHYAVRLIFPGGTHLIRPRPIAECAEGSWNPSSSSMTVDDAHWQQALPFTYKIPTRTVRVPANTLTSFVAIALGGTRVHLNDYGPKHGKSYFLAGDSYLQFGPLAGGTKFPIDIPELRIDPPDPLGRILYYVSDIDSSSLRLTHDGGHFHITIAFESAGQEVRGEHEGVGISPSFDVDGAKIVATMPGGSDDRGRPSFGSVAVTFTANVRGGCDLGFVNACSAVLAHMKPIIEQKVREALEAAATRRTVADAIWNGFDQPLGRGVLAAAASVGGVNRIVRMHFVGDDLEVEFVPAR